MNLKFVIFAMKPYLVTTQHHSKFESFLMGTTCYCRTQLQSVKVYSHLNGIFANRGIFLLRLLQLIIHRFQLCTWGIRVHYIQLNLLFRWTSLHLKKYHKIMRIFPVNFNWLESLTNRRLASQKCYVKGSTSMEHLLFLFWLGFHRCSEQVLFNNQW